MCVVGAAKAWNASPCPPVRGFLAGEAKKFSALETCIELGGVTATAGGWLLFLASSVRVSVSVVIAGKLIAKRVVVSRKSPDTSFMHLGVHGRD